MAKLRSKNHLTSTLKREFLDSINASGGKGRLISLMNSNDDIFVDMYQQALKMIPREIEVTKDSHMIISLDIPSKGIVDNTSKVIDYDSISIDDTSSTTTYDDDDSSTS